MAQGQQQQNQQQQADTETQQTQQTFVYDDNFHPLDFNKDNNVDILDAQLGAQLFGESTALMVTKFIQDENPFDYNDDGSVDIQDVMSAVQDGVAEHIILYMQNLIMNPPYDPEPPVQMNGSTYHPLDINQDGNVDVSDLVVLGTSNIPDSAKPIVADMIQKYSLGQNPYDLNNDGNVNVLDITIAVNAGVPQNILQDMQNNLYTQAPPPPVVPPTPLLTEDLYSNGDYVVISSMLKWTGPIHCETTPDDKKIYFTGEKKLFGRKVLVKITELPNPNSVNEPEGLKSHPFMSNGGAQMGIK